MVGVIMGFAIWAIVGLVFIGIGVSAFFSKKVVNFWANIKQYEVNDVKKYNQAMGILFIVFGLVFVLLGLPLLDGQNSPLILLSLLGVVFEVIAMMAVYILVITKKYKAE